MATEMIPKVWDDLDLARGVKTPADRKEIFGWNGQWYAIDLTDEHYGHAGSLLEAWVRAAQPCDGTPAPMRRSTRGMKQSPESVAYKAALREFAHEHGLRYITQTGKYYYNQLLVQAYSGAQKEQAGQPLTAKERKALAAAREQQQMHQFEEQASVSVNVADEAAT